MALPVGHGLVGIAIGKKTKVPPLFAFLLASFPDIDYFFGLFFAGGNMLAFHRSPLTHSPFFGMFIVILCWFFLLLRRKTFRLEQFIGVYLIVTSHWILDQIILPYKFDITIGKNGLFDFLFTHVLSIEGLYNSIIDLAIYGTFYIVVVKCFFKEKKLF